VAKPRYRDVLLETTRSRRLVGAVSQEIYPSEKDTSPEKETECNLFSPPTEARQKLA
jgi:hypothetical protein